MKNIYFWKKYIFFSKQKNDIIVKSLCSTYDLKKTLVHMYALSSTRYKIFPIYSFQFSCILIINKIMLLLCIKEIF